MRADVMRAMGAAAVLACAAGGALGDEPKPAPKDATPAKDIAPKDAPPKDAAAKPAAKPGGPSLDDLLGLPSDAGAKDGGAAGAAGSAGAADPDRAELDRLLTGQEIAEAFEQAVTLMNDASTRLNEKQDAGIGTQRVQEDIIRKLDLVLDQLQQQQQQSSSSSSSSRRRQQQQQQNVPGRSQQAQQSQQNQGQQASDNRSEAMAPGRQDGALNPQLESARASWGALPERVRELLLQGSSDRFSSKYQAMTEAYYRKLAEERKE